MVLAINGGPDFAGHRKSPGPPTTRDRLLAVLIPSNRTPVISLIFSPTGCCVRAAILALVNHVTLANILRVFAVPPHPGGFHSAIFKYILHRQLTLLRNVQCLISEWDFLITSRTIQLRNAPTLPQTYHSSSSERITTTKISLICCSARIRSMHASQSFG